MNCRILSLTVCVVGFVAFGTSQAAWIANGSFESDFAGWTVTGSAAIRTGYGTTDGTKAVAFNGGNVAGNAVLAQSFSTQAGVPHYLEFDYGVYGAVRTQSLQVQLNGTAGLLDTTVAQTGSGDSGSPAQFERFAMQFTPDSTTTTLQFQDLTTLAQSASADGILDRVQAGQVRVIQPGGAGTLGTLNYLGGNLALDQDEDPATANASGLFPISTSSPPGHSTTAANGHDGAGKNQGFSGGHSWHATTAPEFWRVDLGSVPGLPNAGNHTYALDRIEVYSRTDSCCRNQSDGLLDVLDPFGAALVSGHGLDFDPNTLVQVDLAADGVFAQSVVYRNQRSFNELEVHGTADLLMGPFDTLQFDLGASGNDFVNVEGTADLRGTLEFFYLDGHVPQIGDRFDLLTAESIDFEGLVTPDDFEFQVAPGGNGMMLSATHVPEPGAAMLAMLAIAVLAGTRRRRWFGLCGR